MGYDPPVPYVLLFAAGLMGLAVMMVLGFAHAPKLRHHPQTRTAALPHGHGVRHARANLPVRASSSVARATASLTVERVSLVGLGARWMGTLFSPLTWFSWMLGGGAMGTVAVLLGASSKVAFVAAIAGAAFFQVFVVSPIWRVVFRFESQPAANLEGCIMQEVEVVSAFNARGEGLVRVVVDGRSEDLLAILTRAERAAASPPRRGDRLVIEEVDPKTNTCFVSRR